jgi:segregation and condensation protein B
MKRELEALLFATDSPLSVGRLRKIFPENTSAELRALIEELQAEYEAAEHAFTIVEFGGGWQLATRPEYAPLVERLMRTRKFTRLSRAGLEVLAIIAYRQPITRLEIDDIRGVQSSAALATLQERNLITVVGRSEAIGHPLLYGTTREFLGHLGLRGLNQLPDLPTLEDVVENRDDLREFARQFGADLSDEDFELMHQEGAPEAAEAAAGDLPGTVAEISPDSEDTPATDPEGGQNGGTAAADRS